MLSRLLVLILMSFWLAACGGGGGGGGDTETPGGGSPTAPSAPNLDAGSDTGASSTDNITADNTPTFTGAGGVAGNTVTVYANGSPVGSATVAANGSWSVTTTALVDGSYSITARYTDADDQQSSLSAALNPVLIDTDAPEAPVVTSATVAGVVGTAGAGESIMLYDDGDQLLVTASASGSGNWSIAASALPGATGLGFVGSVTAADLAGNESPAAAVGPIEPPEPTLVTGRVVSGVVKYADVCASVFDADWISLGCTVSDGEGYFGFDIEPQANPVRIEMTAGVSTLVTCSAPAGCGEAAFGEDFVPEAGMTLQLLIPGDQFAGDMSISPLTNMASVWAQKVPGNLNADVVSLSLTRVADLFGLGADFHAQLLPDLTDSAAVAATDAAALDHALFAAAFAQLAATDMVSATALTDQAALMFAWLGGQAWLQSGQIVLDDLAASIDLSAYPELEQWLAGIDYSAYPELLALADEYNVINYIGFDNLAGAASEVAAHISVVVDFSDLVTRWGDSVVTTMGGATGYDATAFADATALLDRFEHYRALSAAAEAGLDPLTRHLAWLYADETSRADTVGMIQVLVEALQFSLNGSICVPKVKNFQSCTDADGMESPYAVFVGGALSASHKVELRGSRFGQTVSIDLPVTDIRTFLRNGTMTIPVTGTITSGTSVTTLALNLDLDISDNDLSGFNALCNLCFANSEELNPLLDALVADLHIAVSVRGSGEVESTDVSIGSYSFSDLDSTLVFNRRVLTQDEAGPALTATLDTGSRTNPAGETLESMEGEPAFDLVLDDPFVMSIAYLTERAGLPPIEIRVGGELAGTAPLVDALINWIEANIDETTVIEDIDFEALLAELDFSLLAVNGDASLTVLDPDLGLQEYHFTISETGFNISTSEGGDPVISLRASGLAGYLYSGETLIATMHLGNPGQGVVLSLVDDSQRFYTDLDAGAMLPFDSLMEFLTLLYEALAPAPVEEPLP